jgi:hypothetical protein
MTGSRRGALLAWFIASVAPLSSSFANDDGAPARLPGSDVAAYRAVLTAVLKDAGSRKLCPFIQLDSLLTMVAPVSDVAPELQKRYPDAFENACRGEDMPIGPIEWRGTKQARVFVGFPMGTAGRLAYDVRHHFIGGWKARSVRCCYE